MVFKGPFGESERTHLGKEGAPYYRNKLEAASSKREEWDRTPDVIRADELPWEDSPQGRIKHLHNAQLHPKATMVNAYIQVIPPGSRSGKHRHMAEEFFFVLEGHGYDLHWDVEMEASTAVKWAPAEEPGRYDWEMGDVVSIPVNTVHQHVNADQDRPARILVASNRIFEMAGFNDLEQIEEAPR